MSLDPQQHLLGESFNGSQLMLTSLHLLSGGAAGRKVWALQPAPLSQIQPLETEQAAPFL